LTFGLNVSQNDRTGMTYFRGSIENGIGWMGQHQSQYIKFNMDLTRTQSLGKGLILVLRGQSQHSPQNLPGLTQYQIGGSAGPRGFREGMLIGDSGYLFSAELRFPLYKAPAAIRNTWQGVIFADHGAVFLSNDNSSANARGTPGYLASYGVGIRGAIKRWLGVRADLGFIAHPQRNQPDLRVHFQLSSQLF
jgi:hemolysin activation/secretion protein